MGSKLLYSALAVGSGTLAGVCTALCLHNQHVCSAPPSQTRPSTPTSDADATHVAAAAPKNTNPHPGFDLPLPPDHPAAHGGCSHDHGQGSGAGRRPSREQSREIAQQRAKELRAKWASLDTATLLQLWSKTQREFDRELLTAEIVRRLSASGQLEKALESFRDEKDAAALDAWVAVLGKIQTETVQASVGRVATGSGSKASRIAALRVLEAHSTPQVLPPIQQVLETEHDGEILTRAVHALPVPWGAVPREVAGISTSLARLLSGSDEDLRRNAALALGDWGRDPASQSLIVRTMREDRSPKVRAAAAFGLVFAPKAPELLDALAERVRDTQEDWVVRENAWRAIRTVVPLPEHLAPTYWEFVKERRSRRSGPSPPR